MKKPSKFASKPVEITVQPGQPTRRLLSGEALGHAIDLYQRGGQVDALNIIRQIADQVPKFTEASIYAARYSALANDLETAQRYVDGVKQLDKNNKEMLLVQADIYRSQDRYSEALAVADHLLKLAPRSRFIANKAWVLREAGQLEQAVKFFDKAYQADPSNTDALYNRTQLPGGELSATEIDSVQSRLANDKLNPAQRYQLHFALAKTFDVQGDIDQEMEQLHLGNRTKRKELSIGIEQSIEALASITEKFSSELLDKIPARTNGDLGEDLIFVFGMPRSGTTLTEQILTAHPDVAAAGETNALNLALADLHPNATNPDSFVDWLATATASDLDNMAKLYMERVAPFKKGRFVTDKSLSMYVRLGLIPILFPKAKIVHTYRNPMDNAIGCYKRLFAGAAWPFIYDLREIALNFQQYHRLMQHWQMLFPGRIFHLEYETLIEDQRTVTQALLDHVGLPWDDACMEFYNNKRAIRTTSVGQVNRALYSDAVARWKKYQAHIEPLMVLKDLPGWQN